jgi:hypothetical protein
MKEATKIFNEEIEKLTESKVIKYIDNKEDCICSIIQGKI